MPIRKTIVTDGITSEPEIVISAPLDEKDFRAYVQQHNDEWDRCSTFDGRVAALERLCRSHFEVWRASVQGQMSIALDYGSREWYAGRILIGIAEVREALARGDGERAASDAVEVGVLAAEAEAKLRWPIVQRGIKRKRDAQTSGRERGKQIAAEARVEDVKTRRLVRQYSASDEIEGTLVNFLAKRLGQHPRSVRRRLKRLKIPTV